MSKLGIIIVSMFLMTVATFGFTSSVSAQNCGGPGLPPCSQIGVLRVDGEQVGTDSGVDPDFLVRTITYIVNWFAWFIALSAVVMGIYSGFLFITARGNTAQLETARQILIYTVVGIVVAILAFSVVTITKTFVGITP